MVTFVLFWFTFANPEILMYDLKLKSNNHLYYLLSLFFYSYRLYCNTHATYWSSERIWLGKLSILSHMLL